MAGYFEEVERADDRGEVFLSRESYSIMNPVAPGLTNVALVVNRSGFERSRDEAAFLGALGRTHRELAGRMLRARGASPIRALGPLAHRAARLGAPGALLVGDAAGFLDPFTGEGIYTALRTAELAADSIGRALEDGSPEHPDLRSYARDWAREVLPKWKVCMVLQHAIRRPFLAEVLVSQLRRRSALLSFLMAAVGDLIPPREVGLVRLLLKAMRPAG